MDKNIHISSLNFQDSAFLIPSPTDPIISPPSGGATADNNIELVIGGRGGLDDLDLGGALAPGFRVKPRGHSAGPVFLNKVGDLRMAALLNKREHERGEST